MHICASVSGLKVDVRSPRAGVTGGSELTMKVLKTELQPTSLLICF